MSDDNQDWRRVREQLEREWDEDDDDPRPKGWVCPRCGTVHAPTVLKCDCKPTTSASWGPSEFK